MKNARAYRKKPVVIEAVQWTGENHAEMCEFIDPEVFEIIPRVGLVIHTLEGDHHASPGDYIIKGVNGEFYPCKPDIFAKTYESAALRPVSQEQVEKVWRGEWVGVPNMGVYDTACSKCGYCPGIRFWDSDFCPNCGAPMTDEAVEIVMRRLEELHDTSN